MVTGTLQNAEGSAQPVTGRLLGDQITLQAGGREYKGKVNAKGQVELR